MSNINNYNYDLVSTEMEDNSSVSGEIVVRGELPSTNSSQQLMPPTNNDNDSGISSGDTANRGTSLSSIPKKELFIVCVLCFVNLINYMDRFTIAGVLTDIQDDFNIGDDEGGLLQTAFVISYMVFAPIFGYLGDRYSRKWIMCVGVFIWSATTVLGSFMTDFNWFITFRSLVGLGEASYSTIAPTIISDLFVHDLRSKMLALFYFAIPVGSGLGYIVGSETAEYAGSWRWALRVTPILGAIAVILLCLIKEPVRGQSEGSNHLQTTTYGEDIKDLLKNRSFMLSTGGFTCVAFVAGALAWWGPKFIHLGLRIQPGNEHLTLNDVSYKFGIIAMFAGLIGVPGGSHLAQKYRPIYANVDPLICAFGLFVSSPFIYLALILPKISETFCYMFVFAAELFLNLCWAIVADMVLFGVITMVAGLIGVPLGAYLSQFLKKKYSTIDPLICAAGLLLSVPLLAGAMIIVSKNTIACYLLIFFGELALNLNWSIVADILLYVVVPTRRSTAEAFQILISHALGDAGSPYLVGVISEAVKPILRKSAEIVSEVAAVGIETLSLTIKNSTEAITNAAEINSTLNVINQGDLRGAISDDSIETQFQALQYALFSTSFVEILGGIFFLLTAIYVVQDKTRANLAARENQANVP